MVERATGEFFPSRDVRWLNPARLETERRSGADVRMVVVSGGEPPMSHLENFNRLAKLVARRWDEQVAAIDGRTATMRDNEHMVVRVIDGSPVNLPEAAGPKLRDVVREAAEPRSQAAPLAVTYAGPREPDPATLPAITCSFDPNDVVIGGSAHQKCLLHLLERAWHRVILHSTFLDTARFESLFEPMRAACARGVKIDLLWGAENDEETETKYGAVAAAIMSRVRGNPDTHARVRVHLRPTGSHAKLLLVDTIDDDWIATVGSCNWLSSPFQSVEISAVIRDQHAVAEVATSFQQLIGRRGLSDDIAAELAVVARELRQRAPSTGSASVRIVAGEAHDAIMRVASAAAKRRLVIGSNRLGSTARPGALIPGEVAAGRQTSVTVLYTHPSGPLRKRHARQLADEARANGVRLVKTGDIPLHGKFIAWDDDNVVVTSLNWASASADPGFPWSEIGIHIRAKGIASETLARIQAMLPELGEP